jgi:hypothetical protein
MRMRYPRLCFLLSLWLLSMGCASFPGNDTDPRPPDEILWTRANRVIDQQRCDVARLTLQTPTNTYPDSKYALDAEDALRTDPRLQPCRQDPESNGMTWYVGAPDVELSPGT